MRRDTPRILPVSEDEYARLAKEHLGIDVPAGEPVLNILRTQARHPALMRAIHALHQHLQARSTLPPRDLEVAIVRIGWLCRSEYEVSQHSTRGGLTPDDARRIGLGPDAPGHAEWDRTLIRAVDELHRDHVISDPTWSALAERYSVEQLLDLITVIGRYWTVSVFLNTIGVQLEEGKPRFET